MEIEIFGDYIKAQEKQKPNDFERECLGEFVESSQARKQGGL